MLQATFGLADDEVTRLDRQAVLYGGTDLTEDQVREVVECVSGST